MKIILFIIFALLGGMHSFANPVQGWEMSGYKFSPCHTFEECQEYFLNKTITYYPQPSFYSNGLSSKMNLGYEIKDFVVTSIDIETKKKNYECLIWTIKEVNGNKTTSFKLWVGDIPNKILHRDKEDEYFWGTLPFFSYDRFKEITKSEIGKVFTDPLVKANYEVTDVYLDVKEISLRKDIYKMYKLRNSISGETFDYIASDAETQCFIDDKAGQYVSTLSKVEKPSNPSVKYGNTTTIEDDGITKFSYKDNYIDITIFGNSEIFSFNLKNVSQYTQKLLWDDAAFVDINGNTSKIIHSGIKYSQKEAPQTPSTIIKGASLNDIACPTSNVFYSDNVLYSDDGTGWRIRSMYPNEISKATYKVQLMLPIQIKDVSNEYIFEFEIKYQYKHPERLNL